MFDLRRIKHCRVCGAPAQYRVPADDNRERAVCPACGEIHYENPINVVGTVPVWGDQVLLCKRNIEPRFGMWTLPAGFLELGETARRGAPRHRERAHWRCPSAGIIATCRCRSRATASPASSTSARRW